MALERITNADEGSLILILSDINMPGMSGLELLPKGKALRPDVPIIMITAYGDAETKRHAAMSALSLLSGAKRKSDLGPSCRSLTRVGTSVSWTAARGTTTLSQLISQHK